MTYDPLVAAAEATGVDPSALRLDDLGSVRTTHLTVVSLSDFNGVRKNDLFSKRYLAGFYASLPDLKGKE